MNFNHLPFFFKLFLHASAAKQFLAQQLTAKHPLWEKLSFKGEFKHRS